MLFSLCLTGGRGTAYNLGVLFNPMSPRPNDRSLRSFWLSMGFDMQRTPHLRHDSQVEGFNLLVRLHRAPEV